MEQAPIDNTFRELHFYGIMQFFFEVARDAHRIDEHW